MINQNNNSLLTSQNEYAFYIIRSIVAHKFSFAQAEAFFKSYIFCCQFADFTTEFLTSLKYSIKTKIEIKQTSKKINLNNKGSNPICSINLTSILQDYSQLIEDNIEFINIKNIDFPIFLLGGLIQTNKTFVIKIKDSINYFNKNIFFIDKNVFNTNIYSSCDFKIIPVKDWATPKMKNYINQDKYKNIYQSNLDTGLKINLNNWKQIYKYFSKTLISSDNQSRNNDAGALINDND